MLDYYDAIIVAIFGCVLSGLVASAVTDLGFYTGLFAGTLVATIFVYDALFRHPPMPPTDPEVAVPLVVWHVVVLVLAVAFYVG